MESGVCQLYLSMFVPGSLSAGLDGLTSWEMYRIFGQLNSVQRQTLISGGKIPLVGLGAPARENLTRMVYGPSPQLRVGSADQKTDIMTQMLTMATGGADYKDEPTEVLPNGIPGGGYMEMTAKSEQFVSPYSAGSGDGYAVPQIMGADEMAMLRYVSTAPMFKDFTSQMPKYDQFKVGDRTIYKLTFHLTNAAYVSGSLKDSKLKDDAPIVAAGSLPSDMESSIQKKMEELKKSPLGALAAMGAAAGPKIHP
jgi:hypothetical protein